MHLRDMLFTHDGNPAKLPNGLYKYDRASFINLISFFFLFTLASFAKLRMILERAEKVLLFQKQSFYKVQKGKADSYVLTHVSVF